MANHPCFGIAICPHCKSKVAIFWNGNARATCHFCNRKFRVKRQKLKSVEPYKGPLPSQRDPLNGMVIEGHDRF